jgi:hypothetical protein
MYDALHKALHELQAAGASGFEGLVLALISRLTGRTFFLARSGAQGGKDASTSGYGATYVDIECKRYRRGESPTKRELVGGLTEAIGASDGSLDLWLVVSTGWIGAAEAQALRHAANDQATAVEVLDWQDGGLPQLAVLCSEFPDEVLTHLRNRVTAPQLPHVKQDLRAVRDHPGFLARAADLRRRLSAADLGLDHARIAANGWIGVHLANKNDAKAAFHQMLCVADADFQPYIERRAAQTALNAWYSEWSKRQSLAVVLGAEGNGKSWVTLGWWQRLEVKPLTLVITANREVRGDGLTILAATLAAQMPDIRDMSFWRRRLRQWLERPRSAAPILLVILDGLNERPREPWDQVFAALAVSAWAGRLAIVATCRHRFWFQHVAPFFPEGLPVDQIEVPGFDDRELAQAWGDRRPALADLPVGVRAFIRTPRIFRLARHHIARLIESGDLR